MFLGSVASTWQAGENITGQNFKMDDDAVLIIRVFNSANTKPNADNKFTGEKGCWCV